ncbi:S9 family peptidase [Ilyomonas limi]|uniref:S9 family peptidase n=1 Tax=Ilyomonas limi TaxID=2575867 RepID=A0A4U3KXX2_9BACT|nr:prolyl oligopeptidase family serine peptidase [Ilyomonas limi]TKK67511.1 S9 family peptidase [Ilyomonas limi]
MKKLLFSIILLIPAALSAQQNTMTPELLWSLGRVSAIGLSRDGQSIIYNVTTPDVALNKSTTKMYSIPIGGGTPQEVSNVDSLYASNRISPDGKYIITDSAVKLKKVYGKDYYNDLPLSNVQIYESLNYRHWDTWEDGAFNHVFYAPVSNGKPAGTLTDIMPNEPYDCPTKPFGDEADYIWSPDSKHIVYVTKKVYGTEYAVSTNTDLYEYDITSGTTKNLTEGMMGYDVAPAYSSRGVLAWLSMKRNGYESDKQDIVVDNGAARVNLTQQRDDIHAGSFKWSNDGNNIYFIAPVNGTEQLFVVDYPGNTRKMPVIKQLTKGDFDVNEIVGEINKHLIITRSDFNHASELYSVDIAKGDMQQLTFTNDKVYSTLALCKTERRFVTTTDNKQMLMWIVYPPNFDATKKYPALLYCQGGPQSPLTQFYSFRWNMQLIASQGYIVVAPSRRGMPGFGTQWNEQVSKDWGGQVLQDYLSAIDVFSKEQFVDTAHRGCIGASFGGFSVYALEGIHNGRFKTFIAHDGIFDFRSMYGTTEELFFENWEKGGPYWDSTNAVAQRSFSQSPSNFVSRWNTPIMIVQGGKDFRVPTGQGLQAFQAAQLLGIKSKLLYFPDENHWVLKPQNALVWQRQFFDWLKETL